MIDFAALIVGAAALVRGLGSTDGCHCSILCVISAIACLGYILYAFGLWLVRPKFDWHLINGHFLRKVCCLVLLAPSLLASIAIRNISSPKQLAFDDNLYSSIECRQDSVTGVLARVKDSVRTESSVTLYRNVEEKLPHDIASVQKDPSFYWSVYFHFIDPGNQHMTTTEGGRLWAALIGILGVFLLNGLLVSSIIGYVDRRKEKWLKGEVRYKWLLKLCPHYVIIGGNDMVTGLVKQKLPAKKMILIQTSRDVEEFRRELFSALNDEEQERIVIYYGNRTSREDIEELHIEKAIEVYILGEETRVDDMESYHDTMNMECLQVIRDYVAQVAPPSKSEDRIVCRVMFEYQTTFSVFQFYDIDKKVGGVIDFRPFSYYEMWAQKVLINKELDREKLELASRNEGYLPLEGAEGINGDAESYVHLFVIGMSRMGVAMGIEAAHLAHYPNYETKGLRTKITFIDKNAEEEKEFFMGRFKELFELSHWRSADVDNNSLVWTKTHAPFDTDYLGGDFLDIEWEFINGGVEQGTIQDYILTSANPQAKVTVAICLPESNRSHAAALFLNKKIYESKSVQQVLVYNRYGDSIISAVTQSGCIHPYCAKLKGFGEPGALFIDNDIRQSEKIGEEINEVYYKIKVTKEFHPQKAPGNYKGKSAVANNWSSIYNGNMLWTKLRCVGYNPQDGELTEEKINILASVEHNRWNIEELLMNFRPLTREEQRKEIETRNEKRDILKGMMAHTDICSNARILEIDIDSRKYDVELSKCLPGIYAKLIEADDE